MLTKSDLTQIRKVVREEVVTEVKDSTRTLDSQIRMSKMQVQHDISDLDDRMKNVEVRLDGVEGKIDKLDKKTTKMGKDILKMLETVSYTLDKQTMEVGKRVTKIEQHLGLPI
ncbi:MAG: hypothetical protein COU25_03665 [Candidatus Levybacteria bacterium CG10_big_fil_rev_8_21_14_0_10_35_13]|nr:MAG: hypothetical protein COU25_03665 [Candidatus Levybacteria bacterium CG10_big_fil_rev_8_21_14_0_10_35_13]